MTNRRTHYFPENSCRVTTGMTATGEFVAIREEDEVRVRGFGHSRLAAIADLSAKLQSLDML